VQYLLLIYGDENGAAGMSPEDSQAVWNEWIDYTRTIAGEGILRAGEALEATTTATSVRVREDALQVTDGPFAETREQLGGFYLIECDDLDTAIEAARRCPGARFGTMEVRPVMPTPMPE
jgi:hypothetical protein